MISRSGRDCGTNLLAITILWSVHIAISAPTMLYSLYKMRAVWRNVSEHTGRGGGGGNDSQAATEAPSQVARESSANAHGSHATPGTAQQHAGTGAGGSRKQAFAHVARPGGNSAAAAAAAATNGSSTHLSALDADELASQLTDSVPMLSSFEQVAMLFVASDK